MNRWGERFIEVSLFIRHCESLNVETSESELEHYERIGAMMPATRVVYPDRYVAQRYECHRDGIMDWKGIDEWPAVGLLSERIDIFGYEDLTDEQLVHCFDRQLEAGNPHLQLPAATDFQPWSDYSVRVQDSQGIPIKRPTAEHYYGYWQAHQLSLIQQYPDLYKNACLIQRIPESDPARTLFPRAPTNDHFVDFIGMRADFDALSFWVTVYGRERGRTFAGISEMNGIRRLEEVQTTAHRKRLTANAGKVAERFHLTSTGLYGFLRKLIELMEGYERKERYRLAEALKMDIFAWEDLLMLTTGATRDEVAEQLGNTNIYNKRTFRHLVGATKEHDYAFDLLNRVSKDCTDALRQLGDFQWSLTEADTNDLLDYCEQEGLGLFMTALSGMVAIGDEEYREKFRRVQKYTNLKNVLTSCEYLLKSVANGSGRIVGNETLTPLVDKIMGGEKWYKLFCAGKQQKLLKGKNTQEFLKNLSTLLSDKQFKTSPQGYWAQNFLVMCLARNMTVHSYPSDDSYYGDLFGPMLESAIVATFYTWRLGKAKGWA